jgi:hypothetical protein
MTSTPTMTSPHALAPFRRGGSGRRVADPHRAIAIALFVAVLIAVAVAVAIAAPRVPDIGSLYVTVT